MISWPVRPPRSARRSGGRDGHRADRDDRGAARGGRRRRRGPRRRAARPFVAPTLAARKAATLDRISGGRVSLHIITGGSDLDQGRDGDFVDHDTRYRRTDEYLTVMRRMWTEERPFDHAGEFYRVIKAASDVKPLQRPSIPLYFGGASEAARRIGARHCDVYMLWGEPLAAIRERIATVRAAAARLAPLPG